MQLLSYKLNLDKRIIENLKFEQCNGILNWYFISIEKSFIYKIKKRQHLCVLQKYFCYRIINKTISESWLGGLCCYCYYMINELHKKYLTLCFYKIILRYCRIYFIISISQREVYQMILKRIAFIYQSNL